MKIFKELSIEDGKLLKEFPRADQDYWKSLEIFKKRIGLYTRFAESQSDPVIKELIFTKRDLLMNQFAVIQARHDLLSDISKIFSRLDDLESQSKPQN